MNNARIPTLFLSALVIVSLSACTKKEGATAPPATGTAAAAASPGQAELPRDVVFRQKLACSDTARAFGFVGTSPRGNGYTLRRNCYSATLNTCIVEYTSLDESATIFDALTGEVLVEYLNFPGPDDKFNIASRIGVASATATATSTAEEAETPQRIEFQRWSAHLFEACAR